MVLVELNIDQGLVMQLVDMGFPMEACRKAVYHTKNSGIEAASNWVMEHMDDPGNDSINTYDCLANNSPDAELSM